jgi:hypothetical protein
MIKVITYTNAKTTAHNKYMHNIIKKNIGSIIQPPWYDRFELTGKK